MKIGILGGTFDPIHEGHLLLASAAQKQFFLDKVLFVPAFIPPHKMQQRNRTPAPYRFRMVELALKNHAKFEISDVEYNRPEISYTVDTLRELKKKYPKDEFYLIVGADTAFEIPTWRESEEIQKMAVILSARRPGFEQKPVLNHLEWIQMPECRVAASQIRDWIKTGKTLPAGILPEEVKTYIHQMNLYQKESS